MPAMRVALLIAAIAAAATASPFPWADAAAATSVASMPVPSNGTSPTRTGHHNPHKEPTPTFKTGCNCQKPIMPIDMLTEDEKCQFEFYINMSCYMKAQGGCPSPTLSC